MFQYTLYSHYATIALYALALLASPLMRKRAAIAISAAFAGFTVQLALLIARWVSAGFLPVTGLFSTLHFLTIFAVGITLYFSIRYKATNLIPATMLVTLLALWKAGQGDMNLAPLTPALDTPLFFLHVSTSFAAYGLFEVGAIVALYRLIGFPASTSGMERRMLDECIYLGYILFSWCMIAGSLWAYLAWGSYWTWRIKGLWSTLLWFYYSGLIHVRNRPKWQNTPLNLLTIAGFGLVLFTFLGLGLLFETSHPLK